MIKSWIANQCSRGSEGVETLNDLFEFILPDGQCGVVMMNKWLESRNQRESCGISQKPDIGTPGDYRSLVENYCTTNDLPKPAATLFTSSFDCTCNLKVDVGGGDTEFSAVRSNRVEASDAAFKLAWEHIQQQICDSIRVPIFVDYEASVKERCDDPRMTTVEFDVNASGSVECSVRTQVDGDTIRVVSKGEDSEELARNKAFKLVWEKIRPESFEYSFCGGPGDKKESCAVSTTIDGKSVQFIAGGETPEKAKLAALDLMRKQTEPKPVSIKCILSNAAELDKEYSRLARKVADTLYSRDSNERCLNRITCYISEMAMGEYDQIPPNGAFKDDETESDEAEIRAVHDLCDSLHAEVSHIRENANAMHKTFGLACEDLKNIRSKRLQIMSGLQSLLKNCVEPDT